MRYRKTAILLASALCAALLLLMPLASSLAESSESAQAKSMAIHVFFVSDTETTNSSGAETEPSAEPEAETENATAVLLEQGDTILFDQSVVSTGTLRLNPADRVCKYLQNGSTAGENAKVIFVLPSDSSEEWLRSAPDSSAAPANLLMVSVLYGENYENTIQGWVDATRVQNLTVIQNYATRSLIHEEIGALREEVQSAMETPVATPLPSATPQNGGDRMKLTDLIENPASILLCFAVFLILLVTILIVLTNNHKKDERAYIRDKEKRKAEIRQCLEESSLPEIDKSVRIITKKMEEQTEGYQAMGTMVQEIGRQVNDKKKPIEKDWDQLIEISKTEMNQTYFEDWKRAFLSKGWIPQAIRTPELNIPGEFETSEFNMSSDFAAFPVHNSEVKGVLYVIPSHANHDLRSARTKDLFYVREGEVDASEFYRLIKPAILHSTNDRFYTVQSKGEILVRMHE